MLPRAALVSNNILCFFNVKIVVIIFSTSYHEQHRRTLQGLLCNSLATPQHLLSSFLADPHYNTLIFDSLQHVLNNSFSAAMWSGLRKSRTHCSVCVDQYPAVCCSNSLCLLPMREAADAICHCCSRCFWLSACAGCEPWRSLNF